MNKPRGIRNNNPGNIKLGEKWLGLCAVQTDGVFCQFKSMADGYRAMGKLLINYQKLHGCTTVRSIINRWAPRIENNTSSYVNAVCRRVGIKPDDEILLSCRTNLIKLMEAITYQENGRIEIDRESLERGATLAMS